MSISSDFGLIKDKIVEDLHAISTSLTSSIYNLFENKLILEPKTQEKVTALFAYGKEAEEKAGKKSISSLRKLKSNLSNATKAKIKEQIKKILIEKLSNVLYDHLSSKVMRSSGLSLMDWKVVCDHSAAIIEDTYSNEDFEKDIEHFLKVDEVTGLSIKDWKAIYSRMDLIDEEISTSEDEKRQEWPHQALKRVINEYMIIHQSDHALNKGLKKFTGLQKEDFELIAESLEELVNTKTHLNSAGLGNSELKWV